MPKIEIIFHTQWTKRSHTMIINCAHVIGSHHIKSTTCLGFNLSKGMLSPNFLLFKNGRHLLLALINVTKNVGGLNCQIIAKTSFLNRLR
jgi:hypothetical protein